MYSVLTVPRLGTANSKFRTLRDERLSFVLVLLLVVVVVVLLLLWRWLLVSLLLTISMDVIIGSNSTISMIVI